jgi:ATPase subunit of ABC transporter with duplicated ATPase domains
VSQVQAQIAQLEGRHKLLTDRVSRLAGLRKRRDDRINDLETLRERRHSLRAEAVRQINEALNPHIQIDLERLAQYGDYTKALINALRGSGMRYNELAASLSEKVSPGELMDFVDQDNSAGLADAAGIPVGRAARLLGHLKDAGLGDIVAANIDDNVRMMLLDGVEYKDISTLSAGQRCTVILSIVLQHKERALVIDQPEDHIDNAFITSTIIKALRKLKKKGQVILSTHNANIPVLGEADLVVGLSSDGRNGFIQVCKPLDDSTAVNAITTLMEGGRQAFKDRANFYDTHSL